MRAAAMLFCSGLLCSSLLAVSACSARHENVRTAYVGTSALSEQQVTDILNRAGYQDVTNLHKNGSDWVGSATHDGSPVNFDIDKDGTIRTH